MISITERWRSELAAAIQKNGGLVTAADLAAYEVKEREPIRGSYRGLRNHQRAAAIFRRSGA